MSGRCTVCGWPPVGVYTVSLHDEVTCDRHPVRVRCVFCTRPHGEPRPAGWSALPNGWLRCPTCRVGAVDTQQHARLYLSRIRQQMAAIGIELPKRVRVQVVEAEAVVTEPHLDGAGIQLGYTHQVIHHDRPAYVTGIYVVAGMPPMLFGRVVAHEIGHAWTALYGAAPATQQIEEGLCELFAYAWLKRRRAPIARALRERLAQNPDPVYGDGFRLVYAAVQRDGLPTIVERIIRTGALA